MFCTLVENLIYTYNKKKYRFEFSDDFTVDCGAYNNRLNHAGSNCTRAYSYACHLLLITLCY